MCLRIDDRIKKPTSPIVVYKCLVDNGDDHLDRRFTSPMHGPHKWTLGENVSDRSYKLTRDEIESGIVEKGFHFYLDRPTDPSVVDWTIIATVEVHPKNIVAMGFHTRYPSLVATQCVWPTWDYDVAYRFAKGHPTDIPLYGLRAEGVRTI